MDESAVRLPEGRAGNYRLIPGVFGQCEYAMLNYGGDSSLAYCAKFCKIMDGVTVEAYCRSMKGCLPASCLGVEVCRYATLFYEDNPTRVYCNKLQKVVEGWTVVDCCRGNGGCDC